MEVSEPVPSQPIQSEPMKKAETAEPSVDSENVVKCATVSVIQSVPVKSNGVEEAATNGHTEGEVVQNGTTEPESEVPKETKDADDAQTLDIQQPSEQLPAELLQGDVTTVASLIDKAEEQPQEEPQQAEPQQEAAAAEPAKEAAETGEPEAGVEQPTAPEPEKPEEDMVAQPDKETVEDGKEESPRKSGRKVKPTEKVLESEGYVEEESVEAIAKEIATSGGAEDKKKSAKTTPKKSGKEAEAETDDKKSATKKGRPKKKDLDEKVDNVMKLGNNMYFYTGPGGQDSPPPLTSDDENEKAEAARKSSRAGKGRNPRLEREDEEVEIPKKLPPKPNLNPNWLKQAAKSAEKKTPAKKKGSPQTANSVAATPQQVPSTPSEVPMETETEDDKREKSPPKDEELPEFDPEKFQPGYVPKTVKKGEDEYVVIVQGVKDTGLCGNYWGDIGNLPSRRRSKQPESFKPGDTPEKNTRRGSVGSTGSVETPGKKAPKKQESPAPPKSNKKQVTKPENPKRMEMSETESAEDEPKEELNQTKEEPDEGGEKKKKGRKRKVDSPAPEQIKKQRVSQTGEENAEQNDVDSKEQVSKKKGAAKTSPEKSTVSNRNAAAVSAALAAGVPAGQQRSVSCVSDTSTQKEVVVECFAPYDDHRWVNIGKERDGMTPDAVQYARALRPPYHLLSFLRIKGHSTKGMSCTDKNTMVFVVLEGEITVILHTTQFNAKKGDSFYIPPKNYYNLINQKAREAELSLIQFQYDGPLPTVNPATTSQ